MGSSTTPRLDRSAPHHASVRVVYKMAQSSATHMVVMGDKVKAEVYQDFNAGCTVDVGELGAGPGRRDVCVEVKAYSDVAASATVRLLRRHTRLWQC